MARLLDLFKKAYDAYETTDDYKAYSLSSTKVQKLKAILTKHQENKKLTDETLAQDIRALEKDPEINLAGHKSKDILDILIHAVKTLEHKPASPAEAHKAYVAANQSLSAFDASYVASTWVVTDTYGPKYKEFIAVTQKFIEEITTARMEQFENQSRQAQEQSLQVLRDENAALQQKNNELQVQLKKETAAHRDYRKESHEKIADKIGELSLLQKKLDSSLQDLDKADKEIERQKGQVIKKAAAMATSADMLALLHEQLDEKTQALITEQSKNAALQADIEKLKTSSAEKRAALQADINSMASAAALSLDVRTKLEAELDTLKKDFAEQTSKYNHLSNAYSALGKELADRQKQIQKLREEKQRLDDAIEIYYAATEAEAKDKLEELEVMNLDLVDQIRILSVEAAESAAKTVEIAEKLGVAESKLEDMRLSREVLEDQNVAFSAEINEMEYQLDSEKEFYNELSATNAELEGRLKSVEVTLDLTDQELRKTKERFAALQNEQVQLQMPLLKRHPTGAAKLGMFANTSPDSGSSSSVSPHQVAPLSIDTLRNGDYFPMDTSACPDFNPVGHITGLMKKMGFS